MVAASLPTCLVVIHVTLFAVTLAKNSFRPQDFPIMNQAKFKGLFYLAYSRQHCKSTRRSLHWNYDDIEHRIGRLFQPSSTVPQGAVVKKHIPSYSQKLMMDYGIISSSGPGMFNYLPLGLKAIEKLIRLIDNEMLKIGAQKIEMPALISKQLFQTTGRWDTMEKELFKLHDRHEKEYCLGPTHEEAVTDMVASLPQLSFKQLPIKLYQITKKYRDESRPKYGLQRSREFLMKDLYSFDSSEEMAKNTYSTISAAYEKLFQRINLNILKVVADSGAIGGDLSHEYHVLCEAGEDKVMYCTNCKYGVNVEVHDPDQSKCPLCNFDLQHTVAMEVGHTFLLGTKYSAPLNASFIDGSNKKKVLVMGCYGLGVSRILAAALEVKSKPDELRWPKALAPYQICIIPPKKGSQEEQATLMAIHLYKELSTNLFPNNVIIDDRHNLTIGHRLLQAKRVGYPYVIISGKKALDSPVMFELYDVYNEICHFLTHNDLFGFFHKIKSED